MSREAYGVVGLGLLAAVVLAAGPLTVWAQVSAEFGLEWWVLVPTMGTPLLCLVATLIAARFYGLRSVAAGAIIAVGLLTVWSTTWRLASPDIDLSFSALSLAGGLLALAAGIALVFVRTAAPPEAMVARSESA